ncbi:MAG TPA: cbb3-type cytochrome oxidase assembly protein CcoS [Bacteroidia bacterium]|jgi:cbb3-type cytochrome oxidase maturation protein|nr:cbb3-type cytochrome oxidase assembly protein CcoS [Bacteroidia bacterium]HMU19232.1 cbb3-type cytochrome oxidase assembly protein CcoS [Bacteroidia bacterium]
MSVLIILIGASLVVAAGFLVSFFWAVRSGQYDDDYSPSVRILFENETTLTSDKSNTNNTDNLNL